MPLYVVANVLVKPKTKVLTEVGLDPWKMNQLSPPAGAGLVVALVFVHPVRDTVPGRPLTDAAAPVVMENLMTVPEGIAEVVVHVMEPSAVLATEVVPNVPVFSSYP